MKKQFFLLSFLVLSHLSIASHLSSANIHYKYIGDQTGIAHQYEIHMLFFRDVTGVSAPNTIGISVSSSCGGGTSLSLTMLANSPQNDDYYRNCIDGGSPMLVTAIFHYMDTIVLSGPCIDWTFSYTCGACRNPLNNRPPNQTYFTSATLNNTIGPNSSALIHNVGNIYVCPGQQYTWPKYYTDTDGDSLFFRPGLPKVSATGTVNTIAPYSVTHPISGVFAFDSLKPQLEFLSLNTGNFGMYYSVEEYRMHPAGTHMVLVGKRDYEYNLVSVSTVCPPRSLLPISPNTPNAVFDTDYNALVIEHNAQDSALTIVLSNSIHSSTLSPDGTDFRLSLDSVTSLPIVSAVALDAPMTDQITLYFMGPFTKNGVFPLYIKIGNDGNTLLSRCGLYLDEYDTIYVRVSGAGSLATLPSEEASCRLYPNPSQSDFVFETVRSGGQLCFYGLQGELVYEKTITNPLTQISTEDIATGKYFYTYTENGQLTAKGKFVKL
ncbi:MAG: T9SS type A sorting domain-containing protein [Schleiferiaceae bacterium]|nr:T9SS type A sorting domain-containing protein [Schleiferiaceae bacterium]